MKAAESDTDPSAPKEKVESVSIVGFVVDTAGVPFNVKIVKPSRDGLSKRLRATADDLDTKAIEAVSHYRFYPAVNRGKPVQRFADHGDALQGE